MVRPMETTMIPRRTFPDRPDWFRTLLKASTLPSATLRPSRMPVCSGCFSELWTSGRWGVETPISFISISAFFCCGFEPDISRQSVLDILWIRITTRRIEAEVKNRQMYRGVPYYISPSGEVGNRRQNPFSPMIELYDKHAGIRRKNHPLHSKYILPIWPT